MALINVKNMELLTDALGSGQITGAFAPAVFVLEPTNRCNVKCVMCPNSQFANDKLGDIDLGLFRRIVENIQPFAELLMLYFLGESTLHPKFPELLRIARQEMRGRLVVSTNALDLSEEIIQALIENVDIIITCIDRWHPESYEKIRVGSKFTSVVSSVERLLQARNARPKPTIIVKGLDLQLPRVGADDLEREISNFKEFWKARGAIPLWGWLNSWAGQMPNLVKLTTKPNPYVGKARTACADLWFKMVINWRGEVVLCCLDWSSSVVVGQLDRTSLMDIWHSDVMRDLRSQHLVGNFQVNKLCAGCREWGEAEELRSYARLNEEDLYRIF